MSKFRFTLYAAIVAGFASSGLVFAAGNPYQLGHTATPEQISGWDIDVRPDGTGLPKGQGSVGQGEKIFDASCASCHGTFGDSNKYMVLAGGVGSLKTDSPMSTVGSKLNYATTLYDYINRAMPFPHSKSLTPDEVYAVTAFVLNLNNIVPDNFVADSETLPKVQMPNRNGFERFPGLSEVHGKPDTHNEACMKDCATSDKITAAIPDSFVKTMYGDLADNFRGLATMNEQAPPKDELPGGADSSASPQALIQRYGCIACHGVDHKIVGPAFLDVAKKFQGKDDAIATLTKAVRGGSQGVWGAASMPPQSGPSDAELTEIVKWVLAGAPNK